MDESRTSVLASVGTVAADKCRVGDGVLVSASTVVASVAVSVGVLSVDVSLIKGPPSLGFVTSG